jgi:hypothetical protein
MAARFNAGCHHSPNPAPLCAPHGAEVEELAEQSNVWHCDRCGAPWRFLGMRPLR